MTSFRLIRATAVLALSLAAVLPAVAHASAPASANRVEAAEVHDDNMIWQ